MGKVVNVSDFSKLSVDDFRSLFEYANGGKAYLVSLGCRFLSDLNGRDMLKDRGEWSFCGFCNISDSLIPGESICLRFSPEWRECPDDDAYYYVPISILTDFDGVCAKARDEQKRREKERAKRAEIIAREKENAERALYERLKAKFEK